MMPMLVKDNWQVITDAQHHIRKKEKPEVESTKLLINLTGP